jgi:hypothetical protein
MVHTSRTEETDHLDVQRHLLLSKFSGGSLWSLRICPTIASYPERRFTVIGALCTRAISITEEDVREGSVVGWVGTKATKIGATEAL